MDLFFVSPSIFTRSDEDKKPTRNKFEAGPDSFLNKYQRHSTIIEQKTFCIGALINEEHF